MKLTTTAPVAFTGNVTNDPRIVARARKSYYAGGCKLMLGGVPCRIARPEPSPTMVASYRETAHGFTARKHGKVEAKEAKAWKAAYALAVKVGAGSVADALAADWRADASEDQWERLKL